MNDIVKKFIFVVFATSTCLAVDFAGGTGAPNDPYQIATAEDLIALGNEPNVYNDCFVLTADIDLSGYVFDRAVIAPDVDDSHAEYQGIPFGGFLEGQRYVVRGLCIRNSQARFVGLFGQLGDTGRIANLGLEDVVIDANSSLGALVGYNNGGLIRGCYCGVESITGRSTIGAMVGFNKGRIYASYTYGLCTSISGGIGGLVGWHYVGCLSSCYSSCRIVGNTSVGGLVGSNGAMTNDAIIERCYSIGEVVGNRLTGGLVGNNNLDVFVGVWDQETSGQMASSVGIGLSTQEMQDPNYLGLAGFADDPNWVLDPHRDYPRLAWEGTPGGTIPQVPVDWLAGEGTREDPYQITTVEQLVRFSKTTALAEKAFCLTQDLDLQSVTWGRSVFQFFNGHFDGRGFKLHHLTLEGANNVALFGLIEMNGIVVNLGLEDVNVSGMDDYVGSLAGVNQGLIVHCYNTGSVSGDNFIGGLVGGNRGSLAACYSLASVEGKYYIGGLVGINREGGIGSCYSMSEVEGERYVGGIAGNNTGIVMTSYSDSEVEGIHSVGGLVGYHMWEGQITNCFTSGSVQGSQYVGGLAGSCASLVTHCYSQSRVQGSEYVGGLVPSGQVRASFWDVDTSGIAMEEGACGVGLTTAEMGDVNIFLEAGWDFVDSNRNGCRDYWHMSSAQRPQLRIAIDLGSEPLQGTGTSEDPYVIEDVNDLQKMWMESWACYRLAGILDLTQFDRSGSVVDGFFGTFDGNESVIQNLNLVGEDHFGLFGTLSPTAHVFDLQLLGVDVNGTRDCVGSLAGINSGQITQCSAIGQVCGYDYTGGLVGLNQGTVQQCSYVGYLNAYGRSGGLIGKNSGTVNICCSSGSVYGDYTSGGLVGSNYGLIRNCNSDSQVTLNKNYAGGLVSENYGTIEACFSTGTIQGDLRVGGLVAYNYGSILSSYSTGKALGSCYVGGLVGYHYRGEISECWSAGTVEGQEDTGGLVGLNNAVVRACVWDVQTSNQSESAGGIGLDTDSMMDPLVLGLIGFQEDWTLVAHQDYPRLAWQESTGEVIERVDPSDWMAGSGTSDDPFILNQNQQLFWIGCDSSLWQSAYVLGQDIDVQERTWYQPVIAEFSGRFDGKGYCIRNLQIEGDGPLGFFGVLAPEGEVYNLTLEQVEIRASGDQVAGLAGRNEGVIVRCGVSGSIQGQDDVGGLVGRNEGEVAESYCEVTVNANQYVGGLVGWNAGEINASVSAGRLVAQWDVGGLTGINSGQIEACHSSCDVYGDEAVGGLIGIQTGGSMVYSYSVGEVYGTTESGGLVGNRTGGDVVGCFWDLDRSGQATSAGGIALSTEDLQDVAVLGLIGWGDSQAWRLDPSQIYPCLSWETSSEVVIETVELDDWLDGNGCAEDPFILTEPRQWSIVHEISEFWSYHYGLVNDVDLDGLVFSEAWIPEYSGNFYGNGYCVFNLKIQGEAGPSGLFGTLTPEGQVSNLGLESVVVEGLDEIGAIAGRNEGRITDCYSMGQVTGDEVVGGLVGGNAGQMDRCYSLALVSGANDVGGVVGNNESGLIIYCYRPGALYTRVDGDGMNVGGLVGYNEGWIEQCYATGFVFGSEGVGVLVGNNEHQVTQCYARGMVEGDFWVGGLIGYNQGWVFDSYSTAIVSGEDEVGGLVGNDTSPWHNQNRGEAYHCFWDVDYSGQSQSNGGQGLSFLEMRQQQTYLDAGWDFVDETDNGTRDIWWMSLEGGLPQFSVLNGYPVPVLPGEGTDESPFLIGSTEDLLGMRAHDLRASYRLIQDIDMTDTTWQEPLIPWFNGVLDGNDCMVSHFNVLAVGESVGLIGTLGSEGVVHHLHVSDVNVISEGRYTGALVGTSEGEVSNCTSSGILQGGSYTGGLIGLNTGTVLECSTTATVNGNQPGDLIGRDTAGGRGPSR